MHLEFTLIYIITCYVPHMAVVHFSFTYMHTCKIPYRIQIAHCSEFSVSFLMECRDLSYLFLLTSISRELSIGKCAIIRSGTKYWPNLGFPSQELFINEVFFAFSLRRLLPFTVVFPAVRLCAAAVVLGKGVDTAQVGEKGENGCFAHSAG